MVRAGTCYLPVPLVLTALDSGITWAGYDQEVAVLSGGAPVSGLTWTAHGTNGIMVATLPETVDAPGIDQLFSTAHAGPGADDSRRLVRARYPNGDSEVDRMPENYDKLGGGRPCLSCGQHAHFVLRLILVLGRNTQIYVNCSVGGLEAPPWYRCCALSQDTLPSPSPIPQATGCGCFDTRDHCQLITERVSADHMPRWLP